MSTIKYLFFAVLFTLAGVASAATVSVVPGKSVGLDDAGYFAGIVTLDIDGVEYQAMTTDWDYDITDNPGWETDYTQWEAVLYSRDDILGGANVLHTSEEYGMASQFFLDGMLGYYPADPLWTASYNEMVWDVVSGISLWQYANREYPEVGSGITLHDAYNTNVISGLDPNYDYSGFIKVLQTPIASQREFLVFSAVPIPSAVWLFGSGLLGLVGVARRK